MANTDTTKRPSKRRFLGLPVPRAALDMDEVGISIGISTPKVYGLVEEGLLKTFLIGRRRFATPDAVSACLRELEQREPPLPSRSGMNNRNRPAADEQSAA